MADFLNQVFQHSLPIEQKLDLIRSNRDFNSIYQDNKYHDVFQSQINSLLSSPAKRVHGFLLLEEYLSEIPKELLGENFKNWASFCVSYIEGSNWNGKNIALSLLDKLLLTGHSDDNTRRKLSLHVVSQIVDYICRNSYIVEKCNPPMVFKLLLTCVTKYSGSCGSKKYIICTFINKNIHSCADGFKTLTAILAYIHYCPTPGQSNVTLKSSWYDHFCACIDNMNFALDRLMSLGVPFGSLKITEKKLPVLLNVLEKENFAGRLKLEQSFKALASVACNMLTDTAATGCLIPVSCVLQLIGRASSVKLDSLYLRDPGLALTVFSVQLQSLRLLEQLISSLRTILTCWSKYIYQSIIGIMDNVSTNETSQTPSTSSTSITPPKLSIFTLKNQCYRLLDKWFTLTGPNVSIDRETADSLLKNFMIDMKHSDNNIELRNIKKTKSREPYQTRPIVQENSIKLHFSCLKACNSFIRNCFMFLPSDQMTFFATFILEEELSLYKKSLSSSLFYGKPETRKELISLIVILCQEDETIPIGVTLRILEKVLTADQSSLVREFCLQSLRSLNGLINPVRILRTKEATTSNPFPFEDIDSTESVPNLPENAIIEKEIVSNNNDQEEEDGEIIDKNHDINQKQSNKPLEQDLNKSADSKSSSMDGIKTDTIEKGDDNDELIEFNCSEDEGKTSDVIMIPEDEKENGSFDQNADCIVYDVESGGTIKTMKLAGDSTEKDDDLEIVSFSPALTIIKRDGDYNNSLSPNKKPKIVQEDCHSQSSSRSLTIIEPTPDIHEIGESSGEINAEIDNDIIKDFVAN